ncbi:MAG: putative Zn finger protein, partial [Myxococcota bacterium]
SDYANRLPRGRTYARNGSILDLHIEPGQIVAAVAGSALYGVRIRIEPLAADRWETIRTASRGTLGSMVELLEGRVSKAVMQVVTDPATGLFPRSSEIHLSCSCPDWADLCKHAAATLYGVGARLDWEPELLFALRGVDPGELVGAPLPSRTTRRSGRRVLAVDDLAALFGVEIDFAPEPEPVDASLTEALANALAEASATIGALAEQPGVDERAVAEEIAELELMGVVYRVGEVWCLG